MKEYKNFYAVKKEIEKIENLQNELQEFNEFKNSIIRIDYASNILQYGNKTISLDKFKIFSNKLNKLMEEHYTSLLKELESLLLVFELFNQQ